MYQSHIITYSCKQCAAVSTESPLMMAPPHQSCSLTKMAAMKGNSVTSADSSAL